ADGVADERVLGLSLHFRDVLAEEAGVIAHGALRRLSRLPHPPRELGLEALVILGPLVERPIEIVGRAGGAEGENGRDADGFGFGLGVWFCILLGVWLGVCFCRVLRVSALRVGGL